jgi:hypothetical protein
MNNSSESTDGRDANEKFVPLEAITRIEQENGRWVVYLNVQSWEPNSDEHPVANDWQRINDYSSRADAQVAATWYQRSANRNFRPPSGF